MTSTLRWGMTTLAALTLLTLSGCAGQTPEHDDGPVGAAGIETPAAYTSYLCAGIPVSAEALAERTGIDGLAPEHRDAVATATFDDGTPLDLGDTSGWFVVGASDDEIALLRAETSATASTSTRPSPDHDLLTLMWVDAPNFGPGWMVAATGGCALTVDLGQLTVPHIAADPAFPTTPDSRVLHLLVTEQACNSGEDAQGRVELVSLDESEDRIELVIGIRPRGGAQSCPGHPPTPFTVELDAPLGDRVVMDMTFATPRELAG